MGSILSWFHFEPSIDNYENILINLENKTKQLEVFNSFIVMM